VWKSVSPVKGAGSRRATAGGLFALPSALAGVCGQPLVDKCARADMAAQVAFRLQLLEDGYRRSARDAILEREIARGRQAGSGPQPAVQNGLFNVPSEAVYSEYSSGVNRSPER
jgi:hypothetical protein